MSFPIRYWRVWLLAFVLPLASAVAWAKEGVAVDLDAPKEVAPLLKQYVRLLNMDAAAIPADGLDRAALVRRTRGEVVELLATEGYFSPRLRIDRADETHWHLVVEPGARATVEAVDIEFQGEIASAADEAQAAWRDELRRQWTLQVDAPFRQADWNAAKDALLEALRIERYAAAKLVTTRADVDPETARARLTVVADSGPTFRLGELEVSGLARLPPDFVARFDTLKKGDIYKRRDLLAFQEVLQTAPQFSVVVVSIDPDPARAAAVPVQVMVREAPPQRLGFGFGASSNTGYRVETIYRHVNLLQRGWELSSGLRLEQRRQALFTDLFLPPRDDPYVRDSVGASFERSDLEGLEIYTEAVGVARNIRRNHTETQFSIRVQHEEIRPDDAETNRYSTLTLNWGRVWRAVDDVLNPRRGHVLEIQLGGGVGLSPEAHDFGRLYGRYQHYFTLGKDNVLTLRGEAGATLAETRDGIPQDFLFRAGGTQSVRGYAYRSLGATEGTATIGARYLATASAEYVRWIKPTAGLALFVDTGDAADARDAFKLHTGYGLGGRWLSPAGPLAVDLAWAPREKRPRLHFGIAVAF